VPAVDLNTAQETYRISRAAFTTNGIPSEAEIDEHLKVDAQILRSARAGAGCSSIRFLGAT
jgi:hypothetical protein